MLAVTRMLLSHNCKLPEDCVWPLSRDDFALVFIEGLKPHTDIQCHLMDHPHWIVEIRFDARQKSPSEIAFLCAQCLGTHRATDPSKVPSHYTVMPLGGLKTTPALDSSSPSLQSGEWGVDIVETLSPGEFLAEMGWEKAIAEKPADQIFKVTYVVERTQRANG